MTGWGFFHDGSTCPDAERRSVDHSDVGPLASVCQRLFVNTAVRQLSRWCATAQLDTSAEFMCPPRVTATIGSSIRRARCATQRATLVGRRHGAEALLDQETVP